MPENCFHASIEGAQHGAKNLAQFLEYAKKSGASGAQPSNYMLQADNGFKSAKEIKDAFAKAKLSLDGISAHCPFWVHTSAWTGTPGIRPFIPPDVAKNSADQIEKWAEDYLLKLMDLAAELGMKVLPMFWGVAFGWELATGYPWGFWAGPNYDLIKEGQDRFVKKTAKLRAHASKLGIYLCHEIHPGTAAMCADEFNMLVNIGYPQRYCQVMGTQAAPLIVEAESAYRDLDATSANGIAFVRDNFCFPLAAGSFEEGMGA